MLTRPVTTFGTVQVVVVLIGLAGLHFHMESMGYPENSLLRWRPAAVFMKESGYFLLAVPLLWTMGAAVTATRTGIGFWIYTGAILAGILFFVFLFLSCSPHSGVLMRFGH